MRRLLSLAAALALALPGVAAAQQHQQGHPNAKPAFHPAGNAHVNVHVNTPRVNVRVAPTLHRNVVVHPGVGVHAVGPRLAVGAPWLFHGHSYAWHPIHFVRPWVYPPGFAYRAWGPGMILPPLFWSSPTYYFAGYADLGLPPPDPGFQYVQYGPDLLLVNVATGEVVQSFPNAFS